MILTIIKAFIGNYWKQIAGVVALAFIVFAIDQNGANRVQARWDKEKLEVAAAKQAFDVQDKAARIAAAEQYRKDIENAKSKAGRDAVAKYVRERLLPACIKLSSGGSTNNSPGGTDDSSTQSGTGQSIEEFANACGQDAMKVLRWQEWATDKGFKIE